MSRFLMTTCMIGHTSLDWSVDTLQHARMHTLQVDSAPTMLTDSSDSSDEECRPSDEECRLCDEKVVDLATKNVDLVMKNVDLVMKNVDFATKNVDLATKNVDLWTKNVDTSHCQHCDLEIL